MLLRERYLACLAGEPIDHLPLDKAIRFAQEQVGAVRAAGALGNRGRASRLKQYYAFHEIEPTVPILTPEKAAVMTFRSCSDVEPFELTSQLADRPEQWLVRRFPDWNAYRVESMRNRPLAGSPARQAPHGLIVSLDPTCRNRSKAVRPPSSPCHA